MFHPQQSWRLSLFARRRLATAAIAVSVASGLLVATPAGSAATATAGATAATIDTAAGMQAGAGRAGGVRPGVVQAELNALVRDEEFPAALAAVRQRDGRVGNYAAGVADLTTEAKAPVDGKVRMASNTKTYVATVVLQLVGEGKVALDAPIDKYLPNLLRGEGIDGRNITVRQVLQHTSGLPEYTGLLFSGGVLKNLHRHYEPHELLNVALTQKADFAPGDRWNYSNTNYVVAGLLVQKVTGRPLGEEITKRVIERARLRNTYWPAVGEQKIRGRHPRGYYAESSDGPLVDVTELDPSMAWAAGALVSTPSDLLKFFTALIGGKLLKPEQLAQMMTTVEAPGANATGDARYGLGLATFPLTCGGFAWTHGGDIFGYETRNAVTTDGRGAAIAVTALPRSLPQAKRVEKALDTTLCR
ncbi:serine hydrolase domain-containing protein [Kribbella deserti]|uniref:Serine hydrolase domain-containing protein n=1 Tax=Kribbella deserti TaxID=1926257 RepID=A0ABV6QX73_9ACTN